MERTDQPTRQPTPTHPPTRNATPHDIVNRLKATRGLYEWTALTALGWGMGPAQDNITTAVHAAKQAGLVRTTTLRGKTMVQLAPRTDRIAVLRESIARRALARIGTPADARILQIVRTGPVLTIATVQPEVYLPVGVDVFRLPSTDETDPDQDDPRGLCEWVLADQYGGVGEDELDRMMTDALAHAAELAVAA
ncbi:hypothetical protein ACFUN7_24345 [Streptomyces sp. NPDC057236]|uniref:hypothetical protein n=1 Tax=Streptomyces sp. NPDC057236 TaxID=3346059 RepID=UPI00363A54ED